MPPSTVWRMPASSKRRGSISSSRCVKSRLVQCSPCSSTTTSRPAAASSAAATAPPAPDPITHTSARVREISAALEQRLDHAGTVAAALRRSSGPW